jgi:hypothetical protein
VTKSATIWRPQSGQGDATSIADTFLITESSDFLITESDDFLILDSSVVTPKDDTIWSLADTKDDTVWRVDGWGDLGSGATATRITVLDDTRVTESGDSRVTEDGSYTPKDDTMWVEA